MIINFFLNRSSAEDELRTGLVHSVAEKMKTQTEKNRRRETKKRAWHTEKQRFCGKRIYSSHSLQWTFCKCLILTLFNLALVFRKKKKKTINLCIRRGRRRSSRTYRATSVVSHVTLIPAKNVWTMILTYQANHVPFVNGLYI